ncbi:MAG: flippase-like domain-containing protein [Leptospiraceae bacterium]|nr:flippase-like domain-containing protein [Leptospiraceae bacterium]MCP5510480.1 flippase-like domain-containing protein [Leptospiraceae bacterium]
MKKFLHFLKSKSKFILGLGISALFIWILLGKFDKEEFLRLWSRVSTEYVLLAMFTQIIGSSLFSVRWYYLLQRKLKLKHSLSSTFIGYGANMVLPARGGDIFRIFYCRSEAGVASFNLLTKLFIEKVIDFILVIIAGIGAFLFIGMEKSKASPSTIFTFSGIVVSGILIALFLFRYQNDFLRSILLKLFKLIKKEEVYLHHIDLQLKELGEFLKFENLFLPLLTSLPMWIVYFTTYYIGNQMLSLGLTPVEIIFILFCGAMSLAVPSAPSGIGVFHASIYTAFLIIGKNGNEGLVYATAMHLIPFVTFTGIGLLFYIYWLYRRRHSGKTTLEDS